VQASNTGVNDNEDTDFGGCYSNQSSNSYKGVVMSNSPPTPKVKKKKEKSTSQSSKNKN